MPRLPGGRVHAHTRTRPSTSPLPAVGLPVTTCILIILDELCQLENQLCQSDARAIEASTARRHKMSGNSEGRVFDVERLCE